MSQIDNSYAKEEEDVSDNDTLSTEPEYNDVNDETNQKTIIYKNKYDPNKHIPYIVIVKTKNTSNPIKEIIDDINKRFFNPDSEYKNGGFLDSINYDNDTSYILGKLCVRMIPLLRIKLQILNRDHQLRINAFPLTLQHDDTMYVKFECDIDKFALSEFYYGKSVSIITFKKFCEFFKIYENELEKTIKLYCTSCNAIHNQPLFQYVKNNIKLFCGFNEVINFKIPLSSRCLYDENHVMSSFEKAILSTIGNTIPKVVSCKLKSKNITLPKTNESFVSDNLYTNLKIEDSKSDEKVKSKISPTNVNKHKKSKKQKEPKETRKSKAVKDDFENDDNDENYKSDDNDDEIHQKLLRETNNPTIKITKTKTQIAKEDFTKAFNLSLQEMTNDKKNVDNLSIDNLSVDDQKEQLENICKDDDIDVKIIEELNLDSDDELKIDLEQDVEEIIDSDPELTYDKDTDSEFE